MRKWASDANECLTVEDYFKIDIIPFLEYLHRVDYKIQQLSVPFYS